MNRAKVVDFSSWTVAWSVFSLWYALYFPKRACELLGYFNRVAELAAKYAWKEFKAYDIHFRTKMSSPAAAIVRVERTQSR